MSKYRDFLFDLGFELAARALDARRARDENSATGEDRRFQEGRLLAFNEVISLMQQQATGLGIDLSELRLAEIDPDRDLV